MTGWESNYDGLSWWEQQQAAQGVQHMGYVQPTVKAKACHTKETPILTTEFGTLYAGGWSRDANYKKNDVVIDLTGKEYPSYLESQELTNTKHFAKFLKQYKNVPAGWLSLPLKDYGVPVLTKPDWIVLADDLRIVLKKHDILVCCQGGHGRTGTVVSILGFLLGGDEWKTNPIQHLRDIYCKNAVETAKQEDYVYEMCGLELKADPLFYDPPKPKHVATPAATTPSSGKIYSFSNQKCDKCGTTLFAVEQKAHLCVNCERQLGPQMVNNILPLGKKGGCKICSKTTCLGTVRAKCGHIVHNQPGTTPDTVCSECEHPTLQTVTPPPATAIVPLNPNPLPLQVLEGTIVHGQKTNHKCGRCGNETPESEKYGLCMSCQDYYRPYMQVAVLEGSMVWLKAGMVKGIDADHCDACGRVLYDYHTNSAQETCYGVSIGCCGHIVHDQITEPENSCDACAGISSNKEF